MFRLPDLAPSVLTDRSAPLVLLDLDFFFFNWWDNLPRDP